MVKFPEHELKVKEVTMGMTAQVRLVVSIV